MKKILEYILAAFLWSALLLRYRIKIIGKEKLNSKNLNKEGGVLFLPNHPAALIDPTIIALSIFPKYPIRPMVIEYMYFTPIVHEVMKFLKALPVPNFESSNNSLKRKRHEMVVKEVIKGLKNGENFLLYPAGRLKHTALEKIGGASATHRIISETPEANIVLVRIKGLWGSRFSRAQLGRVPDLAATFKTSFWTLFQNLLFFSPRRQVIVELHPVPQNFPKNANRLQLNRWLEKWYNQPDGLTEQEGEYPGDSLQLVSYSIWRKEIPEVYHPKKNEETVVSANDIDPTIQDKVFEKLMDLTELELPLIKSEMLLSSDLGLDSLDISELAVFIQDNFETNPIPITELTTVKRTLSIAAKKITLKEQIEEEQFDLKKWEYNGPTFTVKLFEGETIPQVFLSACEKKGKAPAIADSRSGILTYQRLKLAVILLAERIRKMPGHYIGILLPASVGACISKLACQLAGKIPLMINWTIGRSHLEAVKDLSNVQVVLTSWAFLERLQTVDLDGLDDKLVMLETIKREISLIDKCRAFLRSKRSSKAILKLFGTDEVKKDDPAVLLFTSGTESMPKGVPLTHHNILVNQKAALEVVKFLSDDVLLSFLPPFHSFGFCLTGLLGVLSGIRTVYFPDPTDGKGLIRAFEYWGATLTAGAPTFIKSMLKAASKEQIQTMRICVTGAESTPPELIEHIRSLNKGHCLVEGYGITECSPVLAANIPGQPLRGVGKALPGVELIVVHPETFQILPANQEGLILARGENVFSGYLNPGIAEPFVRVEGKEWYNTGDIGFLDENRFLKISGRKKRFLKVGGEMVSLQAIESSLIQSASRKKWPMRQEGATLAVIAKEISGSRPTIYLITTFDTHTDEVNQTIRESGMSNLIRISEVFQLDEIPLMGTGKINYRLLEEKYFS